jgi:hypothetical protein
MPKVSKSWDAGHQHGWLVFRGNECIARLDFRTIDQPFNMFKLVPMTEDQESLKQCFCLRAPDPSITFRNAETGQVVLDADFTSKLNEDDVVVLRDLRIPPMLPTLGESLWSRVKALVRRRAN